LNMPATESRSAPSAAITVRELLGDASLGLTVYLVAGGAGTGRRIADPRIQKSGLVLVGHVHGLVPERIQVLGETELSYIESLSEQAQRTAARHLFSLKPALVLVTRGATVPRAKIMNVEKKINEKRKIHKGNRKNYKN